MRAEPHIPLFLWVTAAIVMHAVGGGGATEAARRLEETMDIREFAADVRRQARYAGSPVEVSFYEEEEPDADSETEPEPIGQTEESQTDETTNDQVDPDEEAIDPKPEDTVEERVELPDVQKDEEKKEEEKKPEEKAQDKAEPELQVNKPPPAMQPNRRVAVEQHVENKEQQDNPDAEFIGEHANHVEEQTRAQITSTDSNTDAPTMGGPSKGVGDEPGNSERTKIAQSDEAPGLEDRPAGEAGSDVEKETQAKTAAVSPPSNQKTGAAQAQPETPAQPGRQGQSAREAIAHAEAQEAMPETQTTPGGSFSIAQAKRAQQAQKEQRARAALAGIDSRKKSPMLGLGSAGLTPNGVNLNLSHTSARSIVGADEIAQMRKEDGERRLSEHRGGWTSMGLERWKPALENYVATVKPGNQTALNTAHSPFARYLNQIHQRLHQVFAFKFLSHLDKLPADHPLNDMEINTHLELALNPQDGGIVKLGVTKSSGVTMFDVGALDSVEKAAPYGPPPASIVSHDGNVYLHWEFHRKPIYACSTYNAHPYILDADQKSAPPRVAPPKKPQYEEKPKKEPDERSGSREPASHDHSHHPG